MSKNNSPYSASLTGCGFMYREMGELLPILSSPDSQALLKQEIKEGNVLMMATETTRKRAVFEFKRRYAAVPAEFWNWYQGLDDNSRKVAMFYVMLKTYRIVFDIQFNVVLQQWNSADQTLERKNVTMGINDIAVQDEFVDTWSDLTKKRISASILSILRKVGLLQEKGNGIQPLNYYGVDFSYYVSNGENWFLEACLLQPYEIETIKQSL